MQDEVSILFRPNVSIKKGLGCSFSCDETMACYIVVHVIGFGASNRNMLSYSSHKTVHLNFSLKLSVGNGKCP